MYIHRRSAKRRYPDNHPGPPDNPRCAMSRLVRRIEACRRGGEQMVLDRGGPAKARYDVRLHLAVSFLAADGTPDAIKVSAPRPLAKRAMLVWGGSPPPDILLAWLPIRSEPWRGVRSSPSAWRAWRTLVPGHWG